MRSTGAIVILFVVLVVGFIGCAGCGTYNSLVGQDTAVEEAWANVETTYQRRADLIPNLVATVEGAADFERGTLQDVVEARTRAVEINLSADDLNDPAALQRFQEVQSQLGAATGALINAVREDYPELGATENFLSLQDQLEGTENRISTERRRYNEVVTEYNRDVRTFPTNIWAGMFGFDRRVPFEAEEGAEQAPTVDFGD
jgi:LemA protein